KPAEKYQKGDIITVAEPANPKVTLTHRIVDIEKRGDKIFYTTKGDANEEADTEKRPKENVLGKVILTIPYLGYPISFAKTTKGLIILIIIPAVIIIYDELRKIKEEIIKIKKK
ncbi:MAG: signal peptidase I, partial [Candidatus Hodarchaeales archaeon]